MKRVSWMIFGLIVLALGIRLLGIDHQLYSDEQAWSSSAIEGKIAYNYIPQPPISVWAQTISYYIFGKTNYTWRLMPLLMGLLSWLLVAWSEKGKARLWALAILAFAPLHILGTVQVDIDGSFLMLFSLAAIIFYQKFLKTNENRWLVLSGLALGLGLLSKFPAVFVIPVLVAMSFSKWKDAAKASMLGLGMFALYIMIYFATGNAAMLQDVFRHTFSSPSHYQVQLKFIAIQLSLLALWIGPLILGLILAVPWKRTFSKKIFSLRRFDGHAIWLLVGMGYLVLVLLRDNYAPIERYFTLFMPSVAICLGRWLAKSKINLKQLAVVGIVIAAVFFTINALPGSIPNFYPKVELLKQPLALHWNFYVPVQGGSGPLGFYFKFMIVAFGFLAATASLVGYLFTKRKAFLVAFFAIALAYNAVLAEAHLLSSTTPNIQKVHRELMAVLQKGEVPEPLYFFRDDASVRYYYLTSSLSDKSRDIRVLDFKDQNSSAIMQTPRPFTVGILDFPQLDKSGQLWKSLQNCTLKNKFTDKNRDLGFVYVC